MSNDITIVTAFFDIGRGSWAEKNNAPKYLNRTSETYIERYSHLAQLENQLIVISTPDIIQKIAPLRASNKNTTYVAYDLNEVNNVRSLIMDIQKSSNFKNRIDPIQIINPEYWNPDYVLVTNLKARFVNSIVEVGLAKNEMIAWIDFGYFRSGKKVPKSKKWKYDFNNKKIHLFNYKPYDHKPIERVVAENDVYILGAQIVAHKNLWGQLDQLMHQSFNDFQKKGLVDDDQGLLLQSYLYKPELFELHLIPDHQLGYDPFVLFQQFNSEK